MPCFFDSDTQQQLEAIRFFYPRNIHKTPYLYSAPQLFPSGKLRLLTFPFEQGIPIRLMRVLPSTTKRKLRTCFRACFWIIGLGVFWCSVDEMQAQLTSPNSAGATFGLDPALTPGQAQPSTNRRLSSELDLSSGSGLRSSLAGWRAYHNYLNSSTRLAAGRQFGRFGPVNFDATVRGGFGFDTNLNSSPSTPLSDAFIEAGVRVGFSWQVTRRNELRLSLALNQRQYLNYPQFSDTFWTIGPVTSLEYRIFAGDFVFTIYDYPRVISNPGEQDSALVDVVNFQQLQNQVGVSVLWHLNRLLLTAGVERQDSISLNNQFQSLNSYGLAAYASALYQLTMRDQVGLRGQVFTLTQEQAVLNNSVQMQAGAFWQSQLGNYTDFFLEAGLQAGRFSRTGRMVQDVSFVSDGDFNVDVEGTLGGGNYFQPFFSFGIQNQLNRYWFHRLLVQRSIVGSVLSNYREQNTISYSAKWQVHRLVNLGVGTDYNFGALSSTETPLKFNNLRIGLSLTANIMQNLDSSINYWNYYSFTATEGSYQRNIVSLAFSYRF
jgi:hypothetical protein